MLAVENSSQISGGGTVEQTARIQLLQKQSNEILLTSPHFIWALLQ